MTSFLLLSCYIWPDFTYRSGVSIFDFEQVNADSEIKPEERDAFMILLYSLST